MQSDEQGLLEPVPVEDTLCTAGLVRIEDVGFGARFVLAHKQTCYEDGTEQRVIKLKVILTWDDVWKGLWMTWQFMARRAGKLPGVRLVVRAFEHRSPTDRAA
jgi:hypothetical protein